MQRTIPLKPAAGVGRTDAWWAAPLGTALALVAMVAYSLWAAFQGANYYVAPYLSPLYSPTFTPGWWSASPAWLVLWVPAGLRASCYYYRKAYYRSLFLS